MDEAFKVTCQVSSTTPGLDAIPTKSLAIGWPVIGHRITCLFHSCLESGTHPRTFKGAAIIVVPKSGRRGPLTTESVNTDLPPLVLKRRNRKAPNLLIFLPALFTVRWRTAYSDRANVVQYRSAPLQTWLLRNRGHVTALSTMDVKGAFDGIPRY